MSNHDESCGGWRIAFRHPGALAGAFVLGGILAFGYSYVPLHGAKDWKIDYQESRLLSQREKLEELEVKLAAAEGEAARAANLEEEVPRRQELDEALAKLKALEGKYSKLEKQNVELTRSRDTWKSRHATAQQERDELEARAETPVAATPRDATPPEAEAEEAAPMAAAATEASPVEDTVLEGARWTSPDGNAAFTLVAAEEGRATLRLLPDGGSIRVESGSNVRIGDAARGSYRVTVMEIETGRAIRISAVPENSDLLLAPFGSAAAPAPR